MQHYRHLGPSNKASNPRNTKYSAVKIKPGTGPSATAQTRPLSAQGHIVAKIPEHEEGDETTHLLRPKLPGKDGVQALRQSYGAVPTTEDPSEGAGITLEIEPVADTGDHSTKVTSDHRLLLSENNGSNSSERRAGSPVSGHSVTRKSTIARSGSITENIIETRGVRKIVLDITSSTDEEDNNGAGSSGGRSRNTGSHSPAQVKSPDSDGEGNEMDEDGVGASESASQAGAGQGKKAKKNRRRKRKGNNSQS
jgi:metal transporter CNNM